jgi:hypothetical protein
MKAYPPPTDKRSKKTQQCHAIQAVLNENRRVTVEEILHRVKPLGLGITKRRIQGHLDFELNTRKRLSNVDGRYKLLGSPPKWLTANPDGSPK